MAAQKWKKNCFECLVIQNPTNQDLQLSWLYQNTGKTDRKPINREL